MLEVIFKNSIWCAQYSKMEYEEIGCNSIYQKLSSVTATLYINFIITKYFIHEFINFMFQLYSVLTEYSTQYSVRSQDEICNRHSIVRNCCSSAGSGTRRLLLYFWNFLPHVMHLVCDVCVYLACSDDCKEACHQWGCHYHEYVQHQHFLPYKTGLILAPRLVGVII